MCVSAHPCETTDYLGRRHIAYQTFADAEAGLSALSKGRIDALVYDRPLLLWLIRERYSELIAGVGRNLRSAGICNRATAGQQTQAANRSGPARRNAE